MAPFIQQIIMIPYVQLAYASTLTANPAHIREDLYQVLDNARQYNNNHQLTGLLLYGNGYLFQYIEGNKQQVDDFYQHLLKDSHHQDVILLAYEDRQQARFDYSSQRYVRFESPIVHFFTQNQLPEFNPYLLNTSLIHSFMEVLYSYGINNASTPKSMPTLANSMQTHSTQFDTMHNSYTMSLKDMGLVAAFIVLLIMPLYLVVTLMPGVSRFFLF